MIENIFKEYKLLKESVKFDVDGYKFNRIITAELVDLTYRKSQKISYYNLVRDIFFTINAKQILSPFENNDIIITNCANRQDYIELIEKIKSDLPKAEYLKLFKLKYHYTLNIDLFNIFRAFIYFFYSWKTDTSFLTKAYLFSRCSFYINLLSGLRKKSKNLSLTNKSYVAFNSAYDMETILTLFFKEKGVRTFQISHGLSYIDYLLFKPFDIITAENINAENVIVWGKSSKEDLVKNYNFSSDKISIGGNPKYSLKSNLINLDFENCLVFLGRNIYDQGNFELLKVLVNIKQLKPSMNFYVKPHPNSNLSEIKLICERYGIIYLGIKDTVFELLNSHKYDFTISYNTTVYYESLNFGLLSFRYAFQLNENYKGLDDKFITAEELLVRIENFKSQTPIELKVKVDNLLQYCLGAEINNYKEIIYG